MQRIHIYIAGFILLISLCFYVAGYVARMQPYACLPHIQPNETIQVDEVILHNENVIKIRVKKTICGYRRLANEAYDLIQESQVSYTKPKKVAILYISTGKYITFWNNFYSSMEKRFLPKHDKTYFLFTDHMDLSVPDNVIKVETEQEPWPYITLKRYHFFMNIADMLKDYDYIYFLNGNLEPQVIIDEEIFPTNEQGIMVTLHPGFFLSTLGEFTYDTNPKSRSYVGPEEGKYYVAGGFNGGTAEAFLSLSKTIKEMTDIDLKNNVIPLWHDESMLNRYLIDYMKAYKPLILLSEYLIPEEWSMDNSYKKILILDKSNHGGHDWLRQIENN